MSFAVITRCTPASADAAAVSTDSSFPCGTVLRKILQVSISGRRRLCVYSAFPLTFARASSRGIARPTWVMMTSMMTVRQRLTDGASDVGAQEFALVRVGALRIAQQRRFSGCDLASGLQRLGIGGLAGQGLLGLGQPRDFFRRGADHDLRLFHRVTVHRKRERHAQ